jgi:hypothetical protein
MECNFEAVSRAPFAESKVKVPSKKAFAKAAIVRACCGAIPMLSRFASAKISGGGNM